MLSKNIFLITLHFFVQIGNATKMDSIFALLPPMVNGWHFSQKVQMIDSTNIFDYMDGGGELYLGYRFNNLTVCEYLSNDNNNILVEIYEMDTNDDAFGLFSLDWSGESVSFIKQTESCAFVAPATRALYGSGLLRLTIGKYYIRIMAFRETADAKNTVMQLGKLLHRDFTSEPEILQQIPVLDNIGWKMNPDKIAFFRSYMVLNSLFYLSHQNLLNLNHSVSAIIVTYNSQVKNSRSKPIQLLILEYPNHKKAVEALNHFVEEFLPENKTMININEFHYTHNYKIEEGWLACKMENNFVSLVFNIPDKFSAEQIINHIKLN